MEWVASTLTLPRNAVYPALLPLMRTPRLPAVDWTDAPRWFKWASPFRQKTKWGFCACAITFQTQSTFSHSLLLHSAGVKDTSTVSLGALVSLHNKWFVHGKMN